MTKKPTNYCSNVDMMKELQKYQDTGIISEQMGRMFLDIANKLIGHSAFRGYPQTLKEDLSSLALEKMVRGVQKYNMKFDKPFPYFTQIAWNAFIYTCKGYYKQINIKRALMQKCMASIESSKYMNPGDVLHYYSKESDEVND